MQWTEYKALCERPQVISRSLIERTRLVLDAEFPDGSAVSEALAGQLERAPVGKPGDHKGDERTDMFVTDLSIEVVCEIAECVRRAGSRPGMVAAWNEYRDVLDAD